MSKITTTPAIARRMMAIDSRCKVWAKAGRNFIVKIELPGDTNGVAAKAALIAVYKEATV